MRLITSLLFSLILTGPSRADELETIFSTPPESAKPGALWMWMGSNVSTAGITRDLESLKDAGFNRTTMFSLSDTTAPWAASISNSPTPQIVAWTEPWWDMVEHAAQESKRLGMEFGMFNGPGYESSGGPWITPDKSMQQLCYSQTAVTGATTVNLTTLTKPTVDSRAVMQFPIVNPENGLVEKPVIPERSTYYQDVAILALPATGVVALNQVVDLTGQTSWAAPSGSWIIYRIGHTTMGTLMQPAQWAAKGFECDKMSASAVTFHMNHVIGEIQSHLGALVGDSFTHVHFDSYEAGTPGWTPLMPQEFQTRRGYNLRPYLATIAGRVIGSQALTDQYNADFLNTIKDLHRDVYFPIIRQTLNAAGLKFLCEPYGGPWRQDEIMPQVESVMTEFWTFGGNYGPYEVDPTIAALRLSGQNIVEAEAFTGRPGDSQWDETPAWLKPIGDAAFAAGINRFVVHCFPHQPWGSNVKPGMMMGQWGTHFSENQTWWAPGKAMVKYWQHCQALLQWGQIGNTDFISSNASIRSIRRKSSSADVWFVANVSRADAPAVCVFEISGKQPELWDPVTGTIRDLPVSKDENGETVVSLDFKAAQSFFIVFRKPRVTQAGANFATETALSTLSGSWQVEFDPAWGGPGTVTFNSLEDWTARAEAGIRYYSGTAVYRKTFDGNTATRLDLGAVNHIARVRINGTDLGVVWTAPWKIDIPAGLLQPTGNALEIEVTNTWRNRLIGDEQQPADCTWTNGYEGYGGYLSAFPQWFVDGTPRPSSQRYCFSTWRYFNSGSTLASSGLLGPVKLLTQNWQTAAPLNTSGAILYRSGSSVEDDIATTGVIPIASVTETNVAHTGGGTNISIRNGTTLNGSGGQDTLNDGATFRGYGTGSTLTLTFNGVYDLDEIRSFASHSDARASQLYTVAYARYDAPTTFINIASPSLAASSGATEVRVKSGATGVVAVRFTFLNSTVGFSVYREFQAIGEARPVLKWDPSGSGSGGGSGSWNSNSWWNGSATQGWASASHADFSGDANGSVVLPAEGITASVVRVGATTVNRSYSFSGGPLTADSLSIQGFALNIGNFTTNPTSTLDIPSLGLSGDLSVGRANLLISSGTHHANRLTAASDSADWGRLVLNGGTLDLLNGVDGSTSGSVTFSVDLNGGILRTPFLRVAAREFANANNSAWLTWNGGVLTASADNPDFITLYGGTQNTWVGNGGAVIDSGGNDIGIGVNLKPLGTGGLTKKGQGTLTMRGGLTYTGATVIEAGVLKLGSDGSGNPVSLPAGTSVSLLDPSSVLDLGTTSQSISSLQGEAGSILRTDGSLTITGNAGSSFAGTLTGSGAITVLGTLRLVGNAVIASTGTFTNQGLLDIMTWNGTLPGGFINLGIVLDRSLVKIREAARSASTFDVTVDGYTGHSYQLQYAASLGESWQNVGSAVPGNGSPILFSHPVSPESPKGFYRVALTP